MSLDGVATLGSTPSAGSVISGRNRADRFLMGLLRACADAVLVGAGTLRATPRHLWTAEHVFPDFAGPFADLRDRLGKQPQPRLIVLTASGEFDTSHPAVAAGATIVTSSARAASIRKTLPASCDVIEAGSADAVDIDVALAELRLRGFNLVLTEGGPHVMGQLVEHRLLDEAFVTISPVLAGRNAEPRLGMVEGIELLPDRAEWSRLLSVRRHGDFLFLRYALDVS
jgi:riboflavin biosynthesis pyrimidine reductase